MSLNIKQGPGVSGPCGEGLSVLDRRFVSLYVVILAAMLAFFSVLFLGETSRKWLMDEWGPVESAGVMLYLVLIALLVRYSRLDRPFFFHSVLIVTLMAAREMDIQKLYSSGSITNKAFYRHGAEGFSLEQIGALVAMAIIGLILLVYLRYLPRLVSHLRQRRAFAFSVVITIVAIPASMLLDGSYRVLNNELGLPIPLAVKHFTSALEECLESAIPIMLTLALIQYRRAYDRGDFSDAKNRDAGVPNR